MNVLRSSLFLVFALTAIARAAQNPNPPFVRLLPGWEVAYFSETEAGAAMKGPDGEVIHFPAYIATGQVAVVLREMDYKSTYLRAIVGDRRVDVVVNTKGMMAVSFPTPEGSQRWSEIFDYWTQVDNGRQAASALMMILTYIDVREAPKLPDEARGTFRGVSADYPFAHLAGGWPLPYDSKTRSFSRSDDASRKDNLMVRLSQSEWPTDPRWSQTVSLMDGSLSVAEADDQRIWARYVREGKASIFVAEAGLVDSAVVAILAALTYTAD